MTHPCKPGSVLPIAVTLAVLVGLYLSAHYLTVEVAYEPSVIVSMSPFRIARIPAPLYSANPRIDDWLTTLFAPAHRLDCELRPDLWREDTVGME
jgi:hypothetical protein